MNGIINSIVSATKRSAEGAEPPVDGKKPMVSQKKFYFIVCNNVFLLYQVLLKSFPKELILQHLNSSELINLTLVSSLWNSAIGSSLAFKNKVKFVVREFASPLKLRHEIEDISKTSTRQYENFLIIAKDSGQQPTQAEAELLYKNEWKRAEIFIQNFNDNLNFQTYLTFFASSIVELELGSIQPFTRVYNSSIKLRFPNLQSLKIQNSTSEVILPFTASSAKLRELRLMNIKDSALNDFKLKKMMFSLIGRQTKLKELELNNELVDYLLINYEELSKQLKLTKLVLGEPKSFETARCYVDILKFFAIYGRTIETLHLNSWSSTSTIFTIWDCIPNLKEFHQSCHQSTIEFDRTYCKRKNINKQPQLKKLSLVFPNVKISSKWLQLMLQASPNVESLLIQPTDEVIRNCVSANFNNLNVFVRSTAQVWHRNAPSLDLFDGFLTDDSSSDESESEPDT